MDASGAAVTGVEKVVDWVVGVDVPLLLRAA